MALNNNADDYANARLGIFFPGYPNYLTGQCVSLVKWFLAEMTTVPNPQAARGNAKDYGDTLVNQGHARVVSAGERKRGDLVVWKSDGGGFGHIGVLLSGDRVFEENVGIIGSIQGNFEGNTVYASRIDPLGATWRKGAASYYRVNTYNEVTGGNNMADKINLDTARIITHGVLARNGLAGRKTSLDGSQDGDLTANHVGQDLTNAYIQNLFLSAEGRAWRDVTNSQSIPGINEALATIPAKDTEIKTLKATVVTKDATIAAKDKEIADLKKQLAAGGTGGTFTKVLQAGADLYTKS